MICTWVYRGHVFEFDANTRAEEIRKVREMAKESGFKFSDLKKEDRG